MPLSVNPALLYKWRNICCCWFDTTRRGVSSLSFRCLFLPFQARFRFEPLGEANNCALYGVVALSDRGGDVALLTHAFPKWVNFEFPIGPEDGDEFFVRIIGTFLRSTAEALPGYSVVDFL